MAKILDAGALGYRGQPVTEMSSDLAAALRQVLLIAAIDCIVGTLAAAGAAAAAKLLFVACGMSVAIWYFKRSPGLYITATFWFWTTTPFIRRFIDYHAGFSPVSIVLVTPNAMASLMLISLVRDPRLFRTPEAGSGCLVIVPILYGLAVNLVQGQIYAGAVGAMDWLIPVGYFFYIISRSDQVESIASALRPFLTINGLVVVAYGLYQAWWPPAWDVAWDLASGMGSSQQVHASGAFTVFGTLNATALFAFWLGTLIVLSLYFRSWMSLFILPSAVLLLLFTSVRSATAGTVLALTMTALVGGRRISRGLGLMAVALIAAGMILASASPDVSDKVGKRLATLHDLQNDDSAIVRARIWKNTPSMLAEHPLGLGIGALGRGAVVSAEKDLVSIDFGPLAIYLSLGWIAGTIYIIGLFVAMAQAVIGAAKARHPAALALAMGAVPMFLQLFIVNVIGFGGAIFWLCTGFACAYGIQSRLPLELRPIHVEA